MGARPSVADNRPVARAVSRTVAVLVTIAAVAAWGAVRYWTDPVTIRRLVLDQLRRQFPGAEVSIDSARLWPGWGIHVTNLTLARKDDPTLAPVLQVPTGRIEHDAEQLAQGRLRVRRLKLERPRLTAVRNGEGRWNVDGLLAPPKPDVRLPIIAIERGTLVVRLAPPGGGESVWEINGIRASLMEDANGPAKFEGKGDSARLGHVGIEGAWRREGGQVDAGVDLNGVAISLDLLRELERFAPLPLDMIRHVSGEARVQLEVHRRPEESTDWRPDWRLMIARGNLGLRDLPIDLTDVAVDARIYEGRLTVKDARARAGDAPISATLDARLPAEDPAAAIESFSVSTDNLLVTPELFSRLPEGAKRFQQRFAPIGRVGLLYRFVKRQAGPGWDARLEMKPNDLAARYHKFPYPLRKVRGKVVTEMAQNVPGRHTIDVTAEINGGARVAFRGTVTGADVSPAVDLWITGVDQGPARKIPVDEDLIAALPPRFAPLARSFHYRGNIELVGRIHHPEGSPIGHDQYHVRCQDAAVCYDAFPVPLDHLAAEMEIHLGPGTPDDPNRGDYWVVRNAAARHGPGQVTVSAWNVAVPYGQQLTIDMAGVAMPLDESLAKALAVYRLGPTWELLAPTGQIDFSSRVTLTDTANVAKQPAVTLKLHGANVMPGFFPYQLNDLSAHIHAESGRVLVGECSAYHGATRVNLAGGEIRTGSGLWVEMRELHAAPLIPDAELMHALPPTLQRAGASLAVNGSMNLHLKRMIWQESPAVPAPTPPVLYWDGDATLTNFGATAGVKWTDAAGSVACRGTVRGNRLEWLAGHLALNAATALGQPLEQLHAQLNVDTSTPDVLQLRGINGKFFDGSVTGEARVAFGGGLDYALDLKALGVRMEDFGAHNKIGAKRLEGRASAQIYLTGRGAGLNEMTGRADIDIPSGQIYDLPLALELLKAVSLRAPDGAAFDEAHAHIKIEGNRLKVERLDLLGGAVSLGGRGELNIDGSDVQLDFDAVWARFAQVLPAAWREIPSGLSRQVLKIKMRGSLDQPKFTPEPVPILTEPAKRLWDRVAARNRQPGE